MPGQVPAWLVTDPECIRQVCTDDRIAKNPQHWPALSEGRVGTDWPLLPWVDMDSMLTNDGIEHRYLRGLLRPAFTGPAMRALRAGVESITDDVLDALAVAGPEQVVDLRAGFTDVVPIRVICALMGVPDALAERLCAHTAATLDIALTAEAARVNFVGLARVLEDLVEHKRGNRGEDLTSLLLGAHEAGQLSDKRLRDTVTLMLTAGFETVATLLDHAIVEKLTHPWVRRRLADKTLSWSALIEETLRLWAPLRNTPVRFPTERVEMGGVLLEPGELIFLSYGAAGRDRGVYADADVFDPDRERVAHLAFGYGAHFCLGAPLARMQAEIALSKLHDRFPTMALAIASSELEQRPSIIVGGHRRIPVLLGSPAHPNPTAAAAI
ncbi:cytochrome P450 [Nocardia takedensis]|uniref:cytochrome P450 n=1 Tax=Nocardia takedensis TaxID=259390 RepID=UPI003F76DAE5